MARTVASSAMACALALALAACFPSGLTPCGDRQCPPGKACHAASGACYGPEQLAACDGITDLTDCRIGDFAGYCRDGICLAPRCGDGIMQAQIGETCDEGERNSDEPNALCRTSCKLAVCGDGIVDADRGEVCDDGNLNAGDACAPDCGSDLTCGNGIVDLGEECDDGNAAARDGCSACRREQLVVQQLPASSAPRGRLRAAMAYDAARERVVVFGGRSNVGGLRRDTWEWDGVRWREIRTRLAPTSRENPGAAYDSVRHRVVLFGGFDGALRDDLWEYDGANWTQLPPAQRPPARRGHAMAYDPVRKRLVVFGGAGAAGLLDDTWLWDGTTWTQAAPATHPVALEEVSMAFDAVRGEVVLFGGKSSPTKYEQQTWTWNGVTWTQKAPAASPPARSLHMTAFDAARGRIVVACGRGTSYLRDVWEWDGTTWVSAGLYPYVLDGPSMAYDAARRQLVSSYSGSSSFNVNMVRGAAGGNFTILPALAAPGPRVHGAAAYDARRGRVVMYGGEVSSFTSNLETWEWDGSRWAVTTQPTSPADQLRPAMTYSARDGVVLLGMPNTFDSTELWKWSGAQWTQLSPPNTTVNYRYAAGFSYDLARDRLLVYGGNGFTNSFEWANNAWTEVPQGTTPGYRHNFAMAYDPLRKRTLLIGGRSFSANVNTYEFDGAKWNQVTDPGMVARGSRMVFDPRRKRLVYLFDPEDTGLQIWDYDGKAWRELEPSPPLGPLYRPSVAFDAVRGEIVMFGGRTGSNGAPLSAATTVIGYQPNTAVEACTSATLDYDYDTLPGCADPDCDARCRPHCVGAECGVISPTCGDGVCDPLEGCRLCPMDCGACPAGDCGNFYCDGTENTTTCPGDCF